MVKILFFLSFLVYVILVCHPVRAASVAQDIREGNQLYEQQKLDEAIEKYNEAKAEEPDSDIVNFNLGTAYYRSGQYDEAMDSFSRSLNTEDKELEAKAMYNMANTKYKLGSLQSETDLSSAISQYRESLDYYKRAMELNERDRDSKFNHELVEKKIKILMDRQKNQEQNQEQESSEQQDKQGKQNGKGKQEQDNEEKQKSEGQDSVRQGEDMSQEDASAAEEQKMDSAEEEEQVEMSPEEARMLLEAYGQEEARDEVNRKLKGQYKEVIKDW